MLVDAAMTHCLFRRQIIAVTGKLNLRFVHPVLLGTPATVRAKLVRDSRPFFKLQAEIAQAGTVRATAEALFVEQGHEEDVSGWTPVPQAH